MKKHRRRTALLWALLLCFILPPGAPAEETGGNAEVNVTPDSIVSFSNSVSHYVSFSASFRKASQLVIRVYDPDGEQVSFKTRRNQNSGTKAGRTAVIGVDPQDTSRSGMDVFFKKGVETGTWTITVTALDKQDNVLGTGNLEVNVREPDPLLPADYDQVREMLLVDTDRVEEGKIRLVVQMPEDPCFEKKHWKNKAYDLTGEARGMCTRCIFSMAVSYLGIDCTPAGMSELTRSANLFYTYEEVGDKLNLKRREGSLEEMWALYESGGHSPVGIHFTYSDNHMHGMLLIARDSRNPEIFYAVNSSAGVNAASVGGEKHDHLIPIIIDDGREGTRIQCPLAKTYHGGRLDCIWCWELTGEVNAK